MKRFGRIGATAMVLMMAAVMGLLTVSQAPAAEGATREAPQFTLPDTHGKEHSLADYKGKYVVLEWINHGCPFVKKHYGAENMQALQKKYGEKGVVWLVVCSSAKGKQGYMSAEEWNKINKEKKSAAAATLMDPSGKVGKAYGAKATPHMFVINPEGQIIYEGAIDSKPTADKADIADATNYVAAALDAAMAGKPVETPRTQAYGCAMKYE